MQSATNHTRLSPPYHFVAYPMLLAIIVVAILNFRYQYDRGDCLYTPVLFLLIAFVLPIIAFKARGFALKAQDRAIRAEENLRHFVLSGKLHDPSLSMKQVIALRFASDEEFLALSKMAAEKIFHHQKLKRPYKTGRLITIEYSPIFYGSMKSLIFEVETFKPF